MTRKNVYIIIVSLALYVLNRTFNNYIGNYYIHWFAVSYFNDFVGAIAFSAYCSILINTLLKKRLNFIVLELILLLFGLYWEFGAPLFREGLVCDWGDIVAYLLGGVTYYILINKLLVNHKS